MIWLWHGAAALIAALVVVSIIRPLSLLAHRYGWVYTHPPSARDVIVADVPFVGGLAALVGLFSANLVSPWPSSAWGITLGMFMVIVFGLMADLAVLPRWHRMAVLASGALAAAISSQSLVTSTGPLFGPFEMPMTWVAIPLTALILTSIAVAFRRVDRADGLCDGLALVATIGVLGICALLAVDGAAVERISELGSMALALTGALFALAFFTWRRRLRRVASVYLSNAGSSMLGLIVGYLLLQALTDSEGNGVGLGTLLWLVAIPVADLLFFGLRVLLTGSTELVQDRSRLQHMLQTHNFTMGQAMMIQLAVACGFTAVAIGAWRAGIPDALMFYGWLAGFGAYAYVALAFWESSGQPAGTEWASVLANAKVVARSHAVPRGSLVPPKPTFEVPDGAAPRSAFQFKRSALPEMMDPPQPKFVPTWRTVAEMAEDSKSQE